MKSVSLLKGGDNLVRGVNGQTYQMEAYNVKIIGSSDQIVNDLFLKAQNEYAVIDNQCMRQNLLQGLEASRTTPYP